MSGLPSPICSWLSSLLSHSISNCTNYVQSLGVKCSLTHSFSLLNLVLLSQVPETNQPTRTKQNFRNMLYFPQIKNTTPQLGDLVLQKLLSLLPLFSCTLFWRFSLREQTSKCEESGWGSSNCVGLIEQWAAYFFSPFYPVYHIFSPPRNGLKPVLELGMVCYGGKQKKLDEIRLGSLELPLMCLFIIHLRKIRLEGWAYL